MNLRNCTTTSRSKRSWPSWKNARSRKQAESGVREPGKNTAHGAAAKVALTDADAKGPPSAPRAGIHARNERLLAQSNAVPEVESQLASSTAKIINKENYEKLIGRREAAKLSGELSSNTDMMASRSSTAHGAICARRPEPPAAVQCGAGRGPRGRHRNALSQPGAPTFLSPPNCAMHGLERAGHGIDELDAAAAGTPPPPLWLRRLPGSLFVL